MIGCFADAGVRWAPGQVCGFDHRLRAFVAMTVLVETRSSKEV
jgi:hypothetical protein